MQWQTDPREHVRSLNEGLAMQTRGVPPAGESFVDNQAAWNSYAANKPADERTAAKHETEERKLWAIAERLDRSSFGQATRPPAASRLRTVYGLLAFSLAFTAAGVLAG